MKIHAGEDGWTVKVDLMSDGVHVESEVRSPTGATWVYKFAETFERALESALTDVVVARGKPLRDAKALKVLARAVDRSRSSRVARA